MIKTQLQLLVWHDRCFSDALYIFFNYIFLFTAKITPVQFFTLQNYPGASQKI